MHCHYHHHLRNEDILFLLRIIDVGTGDGLENVPCEFGLFIMYIFIILSRKHFTNYLQAP